MRMRKMSVRASGVESEQALSREEALSWQETSSSLVGMGLTPSHCASNWQPRVGAITRLELAW